MAQAQVAPFVPPTFPHAIPSIRQKNPGLPAAFRGIDLDSSIQPGNHLDYARVAESKSVAHALEAIHGLGVLEGEPQITTEIVRSAYAQAMTVEMTYSSITYSPMNIIVQLQATINQLQQMQIQYQQIEQRLQMIDQCTKISMAQNYNLRAISRNTRIQAPNHFVALQKTVPGSGRDTAYALLPNNNQDLRNTFLQHFPQASLGAEISTFPPNFDPRIEGYHHMQILRMIVFYNQSFGIVVGDGVTDCIINFRRFLAEF